MRAAGHNVCSLLMLLYEIWRILLQSAWLGLNGRILSSFIAAVTVMGSAFPSISIAEVRAKTTADDRVFDQSREFPNYFLPPEWRNSDPKTIPNSVVDSHLQLLEKSLSSIFRRLEVPITVDGKIQSVRYFEHLHRLIREIDPVATVIPSGGLVRSAIGFIYHTLYVEIQKNPSQSPEVILQRVIDSADSIPAYYIRGVASDFDVLLYRYSPEKVDQLIKSGLTLTNSAEDQMNMRTSNSAMKRAFFAVGDFKVYDKQIDRSTRQGGSELDFLSLDIEAQKLVTPPNSRNVKYSETARNLIRGIYRYLPPVDLVEDADKQTVRGLRAIFELPFLRLESEAQLHKELLALIEKAKSQGRISGKAMEQFPKLVRNSRYSGANNRIYRAEVGSLDADISNLVTALHKTNVPPVVPEFVDRLHIGRASDVPEDLLITVDKFIAEHTDSGFLYHGTPTVETGMAFLRGGMIVSGGQFGQGGSDYGRGGYTSPYRAVSAGYAGQNGMVLQLKLKANPKLRILDWAKAKDNPWIQNLRLRYGDTNLFESLARKHGIDIILNTHVLLENISAVDVNGDLRMLLTSLAHYINETENVDADRVFEFNALRSFMLQMGVSDLPEIDTEKAAYVVLKSHIGNYVAWYARQSMNALGTDQAAIQRGYARALAENLPRAGVSSNAEWAALVTDKPIVLGILKEKLRSMEQTVHEGRNAIDYVGLVTFIREIDPKFNPDIDLNDLIAKALKNEFVSARTFSHDIGLYFIKNKALCGKYPSGVIRGVAEGMLSSNHSYFYPEAVFGEMWAAGLLNPSRTEELNLLRRAIYARYLKLSHGDFISDSEPKMDLSRPMPEKVWRWDGTGFKQWLTANGWDILGPDAEAQFNRAKLIYAIQSLRSSGSAYNEHQWIEKVQALQAEKMFIESEELKRQYRYYEDNYYGSRYNRQVGNLFAGFYWTAQIIQGEFAQEPFECLLRLDRFPIPQLNQKNQEIFDRRLSEYSSTDSYYTYQWHKTLAKFIEKQTDFLFSPEIRLRVLAGDKFDPRNSNTWVQPAPGFETTTANDKIILTALEVLAKPKLDRTWGMQMFALQLILKKPIWTATDASAVLRHFEVLTVGEKFIALNKARRLPAPWSSELNQLVQKVGEKNLAARVLGFFYSHKAKGCAELLSP